MSLNRFVPSTLPLIAFLALAFAHSPHALANSADRIVRAPNPAERITLDERRAAWISPANDAGAVPDDLPLASLGVVLKRAPDRQRAFEQLLRDQQDPASPDYHRWLTPSEVGARFGATPNDIDAITSWLGAQGLRVDSVSNSRMRIRFSGSASQIASAFATSMRYYDAAGEKRIAATSSAAIPAAFADAIASIEGLDSVKFQRTLHASAPRRSAATSPAATYCPGGGAPCQHSIFPADFSAIYNLNPLYQQNLRGAGETISIVGRERVHQPDIDHFNDLAGTDLAPPTTIIPPDGTDPGTPLSTCPDSSQHGCGNPADQVGDQAEATLDVQRAGSVAPGAGIALIVSANTNSIDGINIAMDYAIDHEPVPGNVLSISFTSCEHDNSQAVADSLDDFFAQAAAEGISVIVASGDAGVAGCASLDAAPVTGEPKSVNILCSSQYVTCVGGTEFADAANPNAYWRTTNGANFVSAIGYIPEGVWNEPLGSSGAPQLASSGGGVSIYLPTPSWQTGPGVPGTQGRYTPDVSLPAATREGYFTCMAAQGGPCTTGTDHTFTFIAGGGTSASAPGIAGIAAILNQATNTANGNLNPRLYALAATPAAGVFHDVTVASSDVAGCTVATPSLCNNTTPGPNGLSGGLQGYLAGTGYDLATGLGSVDATNLVNRWNAGAGGVDLDQVGLSGSWYNPATSGQGVVMQVVPDHFGSGRGLLFGGWFTYATSAGGGTRWYSVQGEVDSASDSATLPLYLSQGGNFAAPPSVGVTPIGEVTFRFSDCNHGTMTYSFTSGSPPEQEIPLTRLGANVSCQPGGATTPPPSSLLSGAWYDPATSGQGFVLDVNPVQQNLFGAWYTYATNGAAIGGAASQRWYSLQTTYAAGAHSVAATIYASTGGVFNDPAHVTTTPVGSGTLTFQSCSAATLAYTFTAGENNGRSGTIPLQRATPVPAGCGF
ncbi:MAG: S53 family serine peptidase [Rhodanobacteraceae bacterium]